MTSKNRKASRALEQLRQLGAAVEETPAGIFKIALGREFFTVASLDALSRADFEALEREANRLC